jgi:hypothetical protein
MWLVLPQHAPRPAHALDDRAVAKPGMRVLLAAETGGLPGYGARHADALRGEAGGTAERELSGVAR